MHPFPTAGIWSFLGIGALSIASATVCAQPVPSAESTLLLTWFDDPTTTMAVQWLVEGDLPPRAEGAAATADTPVPAFDAKQIDALVFDGEPGDWGKAGLRVDHLPEPNGHWPDPTGMAALRAAWTPYGLAVLVTVTDDELTAPPLKKTSWGPRIVGDRVEFRLTGADPTGESLRFAVGLPDDSGERAADRDLPVVRDRTRRAVHRGGGHRRRLRGRDAAALVGAAGLCRRGGRPLRAAGRGGGRGRRFRPRDAELGGLHDRGRGPAPRGPAGAGPGRTRGRGAGAG